MAERIDFRDKQCKDCVYFLEKHDKYKYYGYDEAYMLSRNSHCRRHPCYVDTFDTITYPNYPACGEFKQVFKEQK